MKLNLPISTSNLKPDATFVRFASQLFAEITNIFDGQIEFLDNCRVSLVKVSFGSANVPQAVPHTLEKPPIGYITVSSQSTGVVYSGSSAPTTQYLYLQCSVAETKTLLIF